LRTISAYKLSSTSCSDYIYIPLHIEPEATVDIAAHLYKDQWKISSELSLISKKLVYCKIHPSDKNFNAIRYVIPILINNTLVVTTCEPPSYLQRVGTFTLTGTAGMEARSNGEDYYTPTNVFYGKEFSKVSQTYQPKSMAVKSWDGFIRDPLLNDAVLSQKNINNLSNAIKDALSR